MPKATLTSKGQTTIPKEVRRFLNLNPGDKLDFIIEEGGLVVLRAATGDIRRLKGILKRKVAGTVTVEEMEKAIAEGAAGER